MKTKTLIGEQWTDGELADAKHLFSAVCEGVDASISHERMTHLAERGLVENLERGPTRGRNAGRYTFLSTDKLENLFRALLAVKG